MIDPMTRFFRALGDFRVHLAERARVGAVHSARELHLHGPGQLEAGLVPQVRQ